MAEEHAIIGCAYILSSGEEVDIGEKELSRRRLKRTLVDSTLLSDGCESVGLPSQVNAYLVYP